MHARRRPLAAILYALLLLPLAAQHCPDQGSAPRPATVEPGPDLGCAAAPGWPHWHLFTPAHRQVVPRVGWRQGEARALPRVLVRWRCTGSLLLPVAPAGIRLSGYVLDVAESPCSGGG